MNATNAFPVFGLPSSARLPAGRTTHYESSIQYQVSGHFPYIPHGPMETAAAFLLGFLLFLAIVLAVPWYLNWTFRLIVDSHTQSYSAAVNLGFRNRGIGFSFREGLRHIAVGPVDSPVWEKLIGNGKPRAKKKRGALRAPSWLRIQSPGPYARKRLKRLMRSVRWVSFRLGGEVGLDDPASTGRLFGAIWAVAGMIPAKVRQLEVSPNFKQMRIDLLCRSTLRVRPGVLLWNAGPLLWKFRR